MRIESYRHGLVSILLVFTSALSMIFVAMPVLTSAVISHPGGTTVEVNPGENFTLRHRLLWDDPANPGTYVVAIYWDYFGDNAWHFTLDNAVAYFDNDGDNLPDPGVDPIEATVSTADNGTKYSLGVAALAGDRRDGYFNVDITLRASGPDGTPHAVGAQLIEYSTVQSIEAFPASSFPAPITVRVLGRGVAVSISPSENSGPPGATLRHTVNIKNLGSIEDTFTFEVVSDADWSVSIEPTSLTLATGAMGEATLSVVVPPDASENDSVTVVVKATSTGDLTVSSSSACEVVASEEPPAPTAWPAALVVLIAVIILAGGYALYSIFKAGG